MLVEIPPKMSVSGFMGYLKGKSSLPPFSLFIILALVIVVAWVLMLKGIRARPWGQPALC
ncbi:hypothetical protein AWG62_10170 [Escherichia coli]|nr:hypothetical protein AWG62_10170 [Escherichia coli]